MVETDATGLLLSDFGLTTMVRELKGIEERAQAGGWSFRRTLRELLETEAAERGQRRLLRLLKDFRAARREDAGRPGGKPSECARPPTVGRTLRRYFAERAVNVPAFGLPGRDKTQFLSAVGYELIQRHSKRCSLFPATSSSSGSWKPNANSNSKPCSRSSMAMR